MPGLPKALPQRSTASCRSRSEAPVNSSLLPTGPHGVSLAGEYRQDGGSPEHLQVEGVLLSWQGCEVRRGTG